MVTMEKLETVAGKRRLILKSMSTPSFVLSFPSLYLPFHFLIHHMIIAMLRRPATMTTMILVTEVGKSSPLTIYCHDVLPLCQYPVLILVSILLNRYGSNKKNACNDLKVKVGNNSCNRSAGCNACTSGRFATPQCNLYKSFQILTSSFSSTLLSLAVDNNMCNGGNNDVCPDTCG